MEANFVPDWNFVFRTRIISCSTRDFLFPLRTPAKNRFNFWHKKGQNSKKRKRYVLWEYSLKMKQLSFVLKEDYFSPTSSWPNSVLSSWKKSLSKFSSENVFPEETKWNCFSRIQNSFHISHWNYRHPHFIQCSLLNHWILSQSLARISLLLVFFLLIPSKP